jgi:hypothetical protein
VRRPYQQAADKVTAQAQGNGAASRVRNAAVMLLTDGDSPTEVRFQCSILIFL